MAELFRNQIRIYGKHAQYIEALTPGTEKQKEETLPDIQRYKYLFRRVIDVYLIAPLVGLVYHRKGTQEGTVPDKSIMGETVSAEHERLMFNYELVMLLDKDSEPDINKRIARAFRKPDESLEEGMRIFNEYLYGGIEELYESLVEGAATPEDLASNLIEFVDDYNERFLETVSNLSDEDILGLK